MEPLLSRPRRGRRAGFTLMELLLSLGLIAVAILALMGMALVSVQARQKSFDTETAYQVAQNELQRIVDGALSDTPAGLQAAFFEHSSSVPLESGTVTVGQTEFSFLVYVETLPFEAAPNRLKKVDVEVWWWGEKPGERQGMGRLSYRTSRLVDEPNAS